MYEATKYPYTIRESPPDLQYILLKMWQPPHLKSEGNYVGSVLGNMGTGKSLGALFFAWMVDVNPRTDEHNFTIDNYTFKLSDFISRVRTPDHIGQSFIMDEMELQAHARKSFSMSNMVLGDVISTFRYKREIVLYTLPTERQLDSQLRTLRKGRFKFYGEPINGYSTFTYHNLDPIVTYDKTGFLNNSQECVITVPKIIYSNRTTKVLTYKLFLPNRPDFMKLIAEYKAKKISYLDEIYDDLEHRADTTAKADNSSKTVEDYAEIVESNISKYLGKTGNKLSPSVIQKELGISERKAILIVREINGKSKFKHQISQDIEHEKALFDVNKKRQRLQKLNIY